MGDSTLTASAAWVLLWIFLAGLYLLPAIVATARDHRRATLIFVTNFFLGWTLVGWVAVLVWAVVVRDEAPLPSVPPAA